MEFTDRARKDAFLEESYKDNARLKREMNAISLRKQVREEHVAKKFDSHFGRVENEHQMDSASIISFSRDILSDNYETQLAAVTGIQKLLSVKRFLPIDEIIESGAVIKLIQFITHSQDDMQYTSLWALTNIAAGPSHFVKYLVDHNIIPELMVILSQEHDYTVRVYDQACWVLGNIVGDGMECRDMLLEKGVLPLILRLTTHDTLIKIIMWVVSNFCRGKVAPKFQLIKPAIPYLLKFAFTSDSSIFSDVMWSLAFLTEKFDEVSNLISEETRIYMINILANKKDMVTVVVPVLRTFGNFVSSSDESLTRSLIKIKFLSVMHEYLNHEKFNIRKDSCWIMSNVLASETEFIQAVLDTADDLFSDILFNFNGSRVDVRKEAIWCIVNAVSGSEINQAHIFVEKYNVIPCLCSILEDMTDARCLEITFDSITRILDSYEGDGYRFVVQKFIEYEGHKNISNLNISNLDAAEITKKELIKKADGLVKKLESNLVVDGKFNMWDATSINQDYVSF